MKCFLFYKMSIIIFFLCWNNQSWRLLTRKYWFCWFLWWESYDSLSFISFQLDIRNLMGQGKVPSQYITIGDKSQHPEQYDMISFTKCHENDVEERFFSAAFLIYSHSFWQETKLWLWSSTFCKNSKTPQNSYFLWKFWQNIQAADLRQKTWAERARRSAGYDTYFFEDWLNKYRVVWIMGSIHKSVKCVFLV